MIQPCRLTRGGRIRRDVALRFTFDGRAMEGYAGDTLASALLANDADVVGRSFKYHRPRGIMGRGTEEANAILTVDAGKGRVDSNIVATTAPLSGGLAISSQHCWPSLKFDLGRIADLMLPLVTAGFYYKTFMWPRTAWTHFYEPLIRRAASSAAAPGSPDPDRYAHRYAHCDVLVVGAGPAGLAAALAASEGGARVILCDEQAELGGTLLGQPGYRIDGLPAYDWLAATLKELSGRPAVRLLADTTAFAIGADNLVSLVERTAAAPDAGVRERQWNVRAREVILATGAIERPLVFPGNDRPGIMLASAAVTYGARYAVRTGRRAVVVTSHDSGYESAFAMRDFGTEVIAIIDARARIDGSLGERAAASGIELLLDHHVVGTSGGMRVRSIDVAARGTSATRAHLRRLSCDHVLMAGGWTPTVHLYSHARGKLRWSEEAQAFIADAAAAAVTCTGAAQGTTSTAECLAQGTAAGHDAAVRTGRGGPRRSPPLGASERRGTGGLLRDNICGAVRGGRAFVDFQSDVTVRDLQLALREGFNSIEHIKRYTTLGMSADQGRTANLNGLAVIAESARTPVADLGFTTFRPPYTPVTFGALAGAHRGELFDPVRRTSIHEWAERAGAVFEDVGLWKRARYFPRPGEDMHAAVARECLATRSAVGMLDASTLGKIEVVGPDAAEFMNRMYTNAWTKLGVGRCRYGLLLREDGFIFDDGVVARITPDRFHVTTTTGGAARVLHHMEDYLQTEFPELDVWLTSTTEHWAVIAVSGPQARRVIEPLVAGIDLGPEAFPHMAFREGTIVGVPTRLFRVSFSGELGFEINVPAGCGLEVWEAVYESGQGFGIVPYGTEAMHVLRAEKGYIIVGQETDGTVVPADVGLSWAVGKAKRDFVGKRSLRMPAHAAADRLQLVGLRSVDGTTVLPEGAQLLPLGARPPAASLGHVTSAYHSACLGHPIALALLKSGTSRMGERLTVPLSVGEALVEVVSPVFLDPDGQRLAI